MPISDFTLYSSFSFPLGHSFVVLQYIPALTFIVILLFYLNSICGRFVVGRFRFFVIDFCIVILGALQPQIVAISAVSVPSLFSCIGVGSIVHG